jgi:hypothetical protein
VAKCPCSKPRLRRFAKSLASVRHIIISSLSHSLAPAFLAAAKAGVLVANGPVAAVVVAVSLSRLVKAAATTNRAGLVILRDRLVLLVRHRRIARAALGRFGRVAEQRPDRSYFKMRGS